MSDLSNVLKKMLMSHPFLEDGCEYHFIKIKLDETGFIPIYDVTINVILPKKNQSYAIPVFESHIDDIIDNISKYLDATISINAHILVNGKQPVKGGVYISPEKEQKVLKKIQQRIQTAELITNKTNWLKFNIHWEPSDGYFSNFDGDYITFYFYLKLSNFKINGKTVSPNLDMIDELAGVVSDMMYDSDRFKDEVENILYSTLRDEINLLKIDDLYVQPLWYVKSIDGLDVHPTANHFDINDEMFT
jgi:hypothetical protein